MFRPRGSACPEPGAARKRPVPSAIPAWFFIALVVHIRAVRATFAGQSKSNRIKSRKDTSLTWPHPAKEDVREGIWRKRSGWARSASIGSRVQTVAASLTQKGIRRVYIWGLWPRSPGCDVRLLARGNISVRFRQVCLIARPMLARGQGQARETCRALGAGPNSRLISAMV